MLEKKSNKGNLGFPGIKTYYISMLVKTVWYCYVNGQISELYQEPQNINPNMNENLNYEKDKLFKNGVGNIGQPSEKKKCSQLPTSPHTKK